MCSVQTLQKKSVDVESLSSSVRALTGAIAEEAKKPAGRHLGRLQSVLSPGGEWASTGITWSDAAFQSFQQQVRKPFLRNLQVKIQERFPNQGVVDALAQLWSPSNWGEVAPASASQERDAALDVLLHHYGVEDNESDSDSSDDSGVAGWSAASVNAEQARQNFPLGVFASGD